MTCQSTQWGCMPMNTAPCFDSEESLFLSPHCQAGLILQGRLYNDLVCPGATLSCRREFGFTSAYAIGNAELCVATTSADRRQARQKRIDSIHRLQRILLQPSELVRACLIVNLLCRWFGMAAAQQIPLSLIEPLVRVSGKNLEQAWQRYQENRVDPVNPILLSDRYHFTWQSVLNEYHGHRRARFSQTGPTPQASLNIERLLHTALVSGKLTSDSEQVIDQAFGEQDLTDREIDLLVTLKDAIAAGSVKQITSSGQTTGPISKSPYRIFCSLPQV